MMTDDVQPIDHELSKVHVLERRCELLTDRISSLATTRIDDRSQSFGCRSNGRLTDGDERQEPIDEQRRVPSGETHRP